MNMKNIEKYAVDDEVEIDKDKVISAYYGKGRITKIILDYGMAVCLHYPNRGTVWVSPAMLVNPK